MALALYIQFDNIFGGSKYRPSEGWIDVMNLNALVTIQTRMAGVQINSFPVELAIDRSTPALMKAYGAGIDIRTSILEARFGSRWLRMSMEDVLIQSMKIESNNGKKWHLRLMPGKTSTSSG